MPLSLGIRLSHSLSYCKGLHQIANKNGGSAILLSSDKRGPRIDFVFILEP